MKQIPLPIGTVAARTFGNFVVGANALAVSHLQSLQPGGTPVYLWGPSGCGKTHLLQAVMCHLQAQGVKVASFSAADAAPWAHDDQWGAIAVDDCERLAPDQQHGAFAQFVQAASQRCTIVSAGRLPPVDMPVREDLRSRLGWGHVIAVAPLSEPEARAALRRDADRRGIWLSDEVMAYLLTRFARDLKSLFDLLNRLDDFSLSSKRSVTVPLLRRMLTEEEAG